MAANDMRQDRDLVLAPGEYAYVLDTTKGLVNTMVGPTKVSMSNTDQPVVWDKKRFVRCDVERAIQLNAIAPEGFYIALYNPAVGDKHPAAGGIASGSGDLQVGHRINVHGPANFSLWPGQMAETIRGHHLRSNQYLLIQVYNDAAATQNWQSAVLKPQTGGGAVAPAVEPRQFTPGQLMVIKGTDVAFFMPPTGVKVVEDETTHSYVREAVTLERLEYCILLDENGKKRFVQGPNVVFPEPTETFVTKDNQRKFRAIELNETSGLYIKVIADYEEPGPRVQDPANPVRPKRYKAGDELFITGKEQAIYFQREEHSIIRYSDQTKHYAVAVPAGEGRYVLNRNTGEITLKRGPMMLLCDPRHEVIVRRVLTDEQVRLWYPGNAKALQVNQMLSQTEVAESDPSQYEAGRAMRGMMPTASAGLGALYSADEQALRSRQIAGDTFSRGQKFTPPRTITLDTKYEGAVAVSVWTGYAIMVTDKRGSRKVVQGPADVLLEYDETLAPVELSTGTPKTDAKLLRTPYLRVTNNQISDIVNVETKDLVQVQVKVSYRVNFDGDQLMRWFEVENYVKLLTDHMRSKIRNIAKRTGIEEFYNSTVDIVRDTVLGSGAPGTARPGMIFSENNMHVYDVEILGVTITQAEVSALLHKAQTQALTSAVTIAQREGDLQFQKRSEAVAVEIAELKAVSAQAIAEAKTKELAADFAATEKAIENAQLLEERQLEGRITSAEFQSRLVEAQLKDQRAKEDLKLEYLTQELALQMKKLEADTTNVEKRAAAISPEVARALITMADNNMLSEVAKSLAPMAVMQGISGVDVLKQLFKGTPLESPLEALAARSTVAARS